MRRIKICEFRILTRALTLICGIIFAQVSFAQTENSPPNSTIEENDSTWVIHPSDPIINSNGKVVKEGEALIRQRLLPRQLIKLTDDIIIKGKEKRVAKAGDQLFRVSKDGRFAYCALKPKANISAVLARNTEELMKQDCFMDDDNDNKLDIQLAAFPGPGALPNINLDQARAVSGVEPTSFEVINNTDFILGSWVEIAYCGGGYTPNNLACFEVRYRYDKRTQKLSKTFKANIVDKGQQIKLLGSIINVNVNTDGKIELHVEGLMDDVFGVKVSIVRVREF